MTHKSKTLKFDGYNVRIDAEIAPLLSKLWKLGIRTTSCCQAVCSKKCKHKKIIKTYRDGSKLHTHTKTKHCYNRVWVCFESATDLQNFYNIVAEYVLDKDDEGTMYAFINGWGSKKFEQDVWEVSPCIFNRGVETKIIRVPASLALGVKTKTIGVFKDVACEKNYFSFEPQLRFPRKHLDYVESRLDLALKKQKKR